MPKARNITPSLIGDLSKKFVFLCGPRQVGKTSLSKSIVRNFNGKYLLYDDDDDRAEILRKSYVNETFVCLDEFHKYPRWKHHIKGIYDKFHEKLRLLLTGSARLDVFQRAGDSLFGRYYLYHLHPFTCGELSDAKLPSPDHLLNEPQRKSEALGPLLRFGGFPEPFFAQSTKEHLRWSIARRHLLVREDLREITQVQLLALVEQLMSLLPARIGSLFSFRSLAEDIRVSPPTILTWMEIFQRLFIVFKIKPYSKNITRSLHRQPKFYLYDWSQVPDEGARFENLVASHLFKAAQIWTDLGEAEIDLHFIRDRDRREVDFLMTRNSQPWFLIECKTAEEKISENLSYFCTRLGVPGLQLIKKSGVYRKSGNITVASAETWLTNLP